MASQIAPAERHFEIDEQVAVFTYVGARWTPEGIRDLARMRLAQRHGPGDYDRGLSV